MKLFALLSLLTAQLAFATAPIPGLEGPQVSVQKGKLVLTLRMPEASPTLLHSFHLTEEKGSTVTTRAMNEGGSLLEMKLDIDELGAMGTSSGSHHTLPDGRAIPGVPGGAVKDSLIFDRGQGFVTFHTAKSFGVALPLNWDLGTTGKSHHWLNWQGKNIGMLSFTPGSHGKKPYAFVFIRFAGVRGNAPLMKALRTR